MVDPRAVTFQMSSNGVEATRDLANRSCITRIRKRAGHAFKVWPEGDLLAHVEANSLFYLGCVFAILREWVRQGKPLLGGVQHDCREWGGALGWIVENLFHGAPLMDGHEAAQARVASLALTWLRGVCLAVEREGQLGQALSASTLAELCEMEGIDAPQASSIPDKDQARQNIGRLLKRCFREAASLDPDRIKIDGFMVKRTEIEDDHDRSRTRKVYTVSLDGSP